MSQATLPARKQLAMTVPLEHPSFDGHFPGYPIVPGVLCISLALEALENAHHRQFKMTQLNAAKFTAPIFPGDDLLIDYTIEDPTLAMVIYKNQVKAVTLTATVQLASAP
jgi:3-hydroxymyristoyl/3-hydroxydecanoyl-(acyl carrier protein) dehydratase